MSEHSRCSMLLLAAFVVSCESCKDPVSEKPAERTIRYQTDQRRAPKTAAFTGEAAERLEALAATEDELAQLSLALQAGTQPQTCVALVEIARQRRGRFTTGPEIVRLRHAGMQDATIIELARLKQIKRWASDMVIMRQAGMVDATILEIARYRAAKLPVFSGGAFAALRNAGVQDRTLVELVRRAVPEKDVDLLVRMRQGGASDTKILLRYTRR